MGPCYEKRACLTLTTRMPLPSSMPTAVSLTGYLHRSILTSVLLICLKYTVSLACRASEIICRSRQKWPGRGWFFLVLFDTNTSTVLRCRARRLVSILGSCLLDHTEYTQFMQIIPYSNQMDSAVVRVSSDHARRARPDPKQRVETSNGLK